MNTATQGLTFRYVAALCLIAIFATAAFASVQLVVRESDGSAGTINVAGRQRMLSQQINVEAIQLAVRPDPRLMERLDLSIMEMRNAHRALAHGGEHPGLIYEPHMGDQVRALYFDGDRSVDALVTEFLTLAERVQDKARRGALSMNDPDLAAMQDLGAGELLAGLEAVVRAYERATDATISRINTIEAMIWLATLLLLALEAAFIFAPQVRRLRQTVEEHDQAREADRRKAEWLELTQSIGKIGYWFVDRRNDTTFWSEEIYRIHGLDPATFTPGLETALECYHPDDREAVLENLKGAVEGKGPFSFEQRLVRPNGDVRWVMSRGQVRLDEDGEVEALFGIFQDVTERHERNAEIRRTKERYDLAMKSAELGLWEIDLATGRHRWADLIKTVLGIPEKSGAFTGSDFRARAHPDDLKEFESLVTDKDWRSACAMDVRVRHEDGHYVNLHIRGAAILDVNGEPKRLTGSFIDVTDERRIEAVRETIWGILTDQGVETTDKLKTVLELVRAHFGMRLGLISQIEDGEYEIRYAVDTEGEVVPGQTFDVENTYCLHVLKADAPQAFHHVAESEIRNHPCYRTFGLESYIGAPLVVEGRRYGTVSFSSAEPRSAPFTKADCGLLRLIAQWIGYEIGREENIASLRESEERFSLAVQGSSVGVWDWQDVKFDTILWSDQFYSLLGYPPGGLEGSLSTFRDILHPDDRAQTFECLERHLQGDGPYAVEYRLRCEDGSYHWFLGTGQAVWDAEGNPRRMIGSIKDVHERKLAEQMKSEFVSTVSHELRTPMTSIMGALGLIRSGNFGEIDPRAARLLDIATGNGQRLVRLINDILDIEKIEAGKIEFTPKETVLSKLIEDAVDQNGAFAAEHDARIGFTNEIGAAAAYVDPDRIMQVLTNLISNAAKFTGDDGQIDILAVRDHGRIRIDVADNGPGIPRAKLESIFDKFVQIDGGDSRTNEGTGLGLAISKAILEAQDGELRVASEPGQGATFSIILCEMEAEEADAAGKGDHGAFRDRARMRRRVLHVEDDRDTADLFGHLISDVADVDNVSSVAVAKQRLSRVPYDLVVLDIRLPDQPGQVVIEHLFQTDGAEAPPVIIYSVDDVTGFPQPPFVARAFVKTQVDNETLRAAVLDTLRSGRAHEQGAANHRRAG